MKKIIVACGGGIATSQTVAVKLENLLKEKGLGHKASIEAININSIPTYIKSSDIYVSITQEPEGKYDIPVFSGIPFLTGIGVEEELEKIIDIVNT
ncbi:PTS sugar transporter subunit IIB [Oceanobacillus sp. CFH 90083]|uniref:PTS sugar transporter subunit IIB n=1 Tax=Oceanobacillus sp. CFH 90083 TaxID=2592336 RepID=UPI00128B45BD|nr:PTS sugar transporter subunit IIB [Oceanobacillus sp. CFH 90083]